jgi:hypothetical protein
MVLTVRKWLFAMGVLVVGALLTGEAHALPPTSPGIERVTNAGDYFPDTLGSQWRYRGEVVEGPLQTIAKKGFLNVSMVKRTDKIQGVVVKVFHDTNPGNHGPSDSYYRRDPAGIVYYGSEPGTPIERQLIPYQIVRFPLDLPSSFQQFNRKGLDFGSDLDGDEQNEQADMEAVVTAVGKESVSVPAGSYPDTVRIEARMTMRISLSGLQKVAIGTDTMTAWFAKGVGLIKYIERQELPPLRSDRGLVTEITEELESFTITPQTSSLP